MKDKIISAISSPKELEALYQENPEGFGEAFFEIFSERADSLILQTWNERLTYKKDRESNTNDQGSSIKNFVVIVCLILFGGTLFNYFVNSGDYKITEWFMSRIFFTTPIVLLMIYFFFQKEHSWKTTAFVFGITLVAIIYIIIIPNQHEWAYNYYKNHRTFNDALVAVELHIPLLLWLVAGISYVGSNWKTTSKWIEYLRFNGEFLIYLTLISISTIVLSAITFALLGLIESRWELTNWYEENIIMYEVVAVPIVATFLIEKITGKKLRIAPILAKIFSPLFLITTIIYLLIMAIYQNSPYDDRETLVTFNFLMLLVLGMSIFSIAERNPNAKSSFTDYVNLGLIITTAIINLIALTAVIFRIFNDDYGFTPNRITILGINVLVFIHLIGIFVNYMRFVYNKASYEKTGDWITKYLPIYGIWAIIISILMPILFWYK